MGLFGKKHDTKLRKERIIVSEGSSRFGSHGYTRLRDNLIYINSDNNHKIIQIESAMAKECKTSVTANLSVSLGLTEKKVVVVDLDFRRPRLHRVFGLTKENGIAEYMMGSVSMEQIVKKTKYKNVSLITRGTEVYNPALILVSDKFRELINYLRDNFDFVLLDCAPVLQVSDYIHISKVSDGALFLVAYGRTTKAQVSEAIKELRKNNIKILGTLFTMYDRKKDSRYGYGYGGYYGKYYDSAYGDVPLALHAHDDNNEEPKADASSDKQKKDDKKDSVK